MHQIRPPIQTQSLQPRRVDNIRLRSVVVGELPVVFDDAVFVPVALRCFEGVDDPGFLVEAADEGDGVDVVVGEYAERGPESEQ